MDSINFGSPIKNSSMNFHDNGIFTKENISQENPLIDSKSEKSYSQVGLFNKPDDVLTTVTNSVKT